MQKRVFAYKLRYLACNCLLIRQLHTVGVIIRPQRQKIGPTVCYFPSVQMENNMHTYAILCPYGRIITYGYILTIFSP